MMRVMKLLSRIVIALALTAALCPGLAEAAEPAKIPSPGNEGWMSVVIAMVLAVGVAVGSFVNPKRSHRD